MPSFDEMIQKHFNKPAHEVPHEEKYGYVINIIGLENVIPYIPYPKIQLINAYKDGNTCFNNSFSKRKSDFNLTTWEWAGTHLLRLYRYELGITSWSLAQCVSLMKQAAKLSISDAL